MTETTLNCRHSDYKIKLVVLSASHPLYLSCEQKKTQWIYENINMMSCEPAREKTSHQSTWEAQESEHQELIVHHPLRAYAISTWDEQRMHDRMKCFRVRVHALPLAATSYKLAHKFKLKVK